MSIKALTLAALMSLPSLPDLVVERIIHYAVQFELTDLQKENFKNAGKVSTGVTYRDFGPGKTWMEVLHKYGQVSRHWKSVIFQSSKLFDAEKNV